MEIPTNKEVLLDEIREQGELGMALNPSCPEHLLAVQLQQEGLIEGSPFQAGLILWIAVTD